MSAVFGLALLLSSGEAEAHDIDSDRDGLSDDLEQQLLVRFVPFFKISTTECDGLPAEFQPNVAVPRAVAKNGTIYGQVFPVRASSQESNGAFIEIHYYHLWSNDCGRISHPLDSEHVSALVHAPMPESTPNQWKALYWYAAAHQDTVCDAGNGAKAFSISAVDRGAAVWISRGKHASYLSDRLCQRGCGGDRCDEMERFVPSRIVNLGEPGAAMNGATWVNSRSWTLAEKMSPEFNESIVRELAKSDLAGVVSLNSSFVAMQSVVLAGGATADGMATGNRHTEQALATSYEKVDGSLRKAFRATKRGLRQVW